jgi:hypothetical protein
VNAGADFNSIDIAGETPVHMAAMVSSFTQSDHISSVPLNINISFI